MYVTTSFCVAVCGGGSETTIDGATVSGPTPYSASSALQYDDGGSCERSPSMPLSSASFAKKIGTTVGARSTPPVAARFLSSGRAPCGPGTNGPASTSAPASPSRYGKPSPQPSANAATK